MIIIIEEVRTSNELLSLDEDGIVHLRFPKKTRHTLETIKEHLRGIEQLDYKGDGVLLLVHFKNLVGMDKSSRKFVNTQRMVKSHKACAMLVHNSLSKLIAHFFLGINKPNFVISSFTNVERAKKWLLEQ